METNEIKETMGFFAINFNRGDGFWARRWNFFESINNRGDTFIRSHRVGKKKLDVLRADTSIGQCRKPISSYQKKVEFRHRRFK